MGRGLNLKVNSALVLLLLSSMAFGLEAEYKNTLTKVELIKTTENSYDINLHTQKKFQEPIKVIKKSDLNYYILLPETRNNTTQTTLNVADIRNITTNSYAYAGADIDNGYTKININTTKPINFSINVKSLISENTVKPELKEKIANEEVNLVPAEEKKVQKKNFGFQQEKKQETKPLKRLKKEDKSLQISKKQQKQTESTENLKEIKIEDLIKEDVENAIASGLVDGTGKNYDTQEFGYGEDIIVDELEEIEQAVIPKSDVAASAKLDNLDGKFSTLISRIENKLSDYGISFKDVMFMILAVITTFFVVLFALNRKTSNTKIKSKADLIEKLDKQDNLVAKTPERSVENNGQYFIFDKNIRQTGFCNPATTTSKRNYELSSYEPDLRKNYKGPQVEQYQTKERVARKHTPDSEYDIIQKILKEDSMMDIPVQKTEAAKPQTNAGVQTSNKTNVNTQVKPLEKTKVIQEPTILSSVEIAPERGFMCVSYNDNINLMGYIFDDVFPLYNFKRAKLENYDIKFRLSEKDDKGASFIIKVYDTRILARVTKNSMNLEVVM